MNFIDGEHRVIDGIDTSVLPDRPNEWSTADQRFVQRWLPGAFGPDLETIEGVWAYKVEEDEWEDGDPPRRTIKRATIHERKANA